MANSIIKKPFDAGLNKLVKSFHKYMPVKKIGDNPKLILIGEYHGRHFMEQEEMIKYIKPAQIVHERLSDHYIKPGYVYRVNKDYRYMYDAKVEDEFYAIDQVIAYSEKNIVMANPIFLKILKNRDTTAQALKKLNMSSSFDLYEYFRDKMNWSTRTDKVKGRCKLIVAKEAFCFFYLMKWAELYRMNIFGADFTQGEIAKIKVKFLKNFVRGLREQNMLDIARASLTVNGYTLGIFGDGHACGASELIKGLKEKKVPFYLINVDRSKENLSSANRYFEDPNSTRTDII